MRNNNVKYKLLDFFNAEIAKLVTSIVIKNYINSRQVNWSNYFLVNDRNTKSKDNNNLIDKNSNCLRSLNYLDKLFGIYDWAKSIYLIFYISN